jgi:NAD+ kinase
MTQPTPIGRVRVRGAASDPDLGPLEAVEADAEAHAQAVVAVGAEAVAEQALSDDSSPILPVSVDDCAGTAQDTLDGAVDALAAGDYRTVAHPVLGVSVDGEEVARGVLDVTLMTTEPARISEYALAADDERLFDVRADGVVVSTPLGSAGYGRAAGGPVVAPGAGLSVVPVSPFSTRASPWVVPGPLSLSVERDEGEVSLYVDGAEVGQVSPGESVVVERVGTFTCLRPLAE